MRGSCNSAFWVRNVFLETVVLSSVLEGVADVRQWHVVHMAEIKSGEGRGGVGGGGTQDIPAILRKVDGSFLKRRKFFNTREAL